MVTIGGILMREPPISPYYPFLGGIAALVFIFLILQASFLVQQGNIEEAIQVGLAATALISFMYAGTLILFASFIFPNFIPKLVSEEGSLFDGAKEFSLGFIVFFMISLLSANFSIFKFAILDVTNGLFAQTAATLGGFWGYYLVVIGAPIAEEFLFFIALPGILYAFLLGLSRIKGFELLENFFLQTILVVLIVSPIFAAFHIGQDGLVTFFIAAMIFRGIILFIGMDVRQDFIPLISAGALFAIGGHTANNIQATGGILNFINNMAFGTTTLFETTSGILVLTAFASIFGLFFYGLISGRYFE